MKLSTERVFNMLNTFLHVHRKTNQVRTIAMVPDGSNNRCSKCMWRRCDVNTGSNRMRTSTYCSKSFGLQPCSGSSREDGVPVYFYDVSTDRDMFRNTSDETPDFGRFVENYYGHKFILRKNGDWYAVNADKCTPTKHPGEWRYTDWLPY